MNLLLLPEALPELRLPPEDARRRHILEVLRMRVGDRFDVGAENGSRGKARIEADSPADGMALHLEWGETPAPPPDLHLLVGLSRPQTCRRILREGASLGLRRLHFFPAEKSELGYARSTLWTSGEWRRLLIEGVEQAFDTWVPEVRHSPSLAEALQAESPRPCVALDNYEASAPLAQWLQGRPSTPSLIIGPERGWSGAERDHFRAADIPLAHLGTRVLRTDTAALAALTLASQI